MASKTETGNAKNVANFNLFVEFVKGYGAKYNPTKNKLKLAQLIAKQTAAELILEKVITDNTAFNDRVNERIIEFKEVNTYATRLINALESTDASAEKVKNARVFNRKIQGKRVTTLETPVDPNTPAPKTISASQQSFDQKIQHFAGILSVLESETSYVPNEIELSIAEVNLKKAKLIMRNKAVDNAYITISNTRIDRDNNLYLDKIGMVDVALEAKTYIRSLFGATSPEYKQVAGIAFKKPKKK